MWLNITIDCKSIYGEILSYFYRKSPSTNPLFHVTDLPRPINISYWWNFGSLLGLCLRVQLATGIFLAMHYTRDTTIAFFRVNHIGRDVEFGWLIRIIHANGARAFFLALYLHIGRGMYYGRYRLIHTWGVGVAILLATIATAFLGYVLPWGQISFWGASVITNLVRAVPYVGQDIVYWLWGGFAVDNATLTRFFALHFLLPFIIVVLVLGHLFFLHETGSNNPLGLPSDFSKIPFHPYFTLKDLLGALVFSIGLMWIRITSPWMLGDPENFITSNPLVTPVHIQPEWYFLFAYAILRSIPNKLGGVIALVVSVVILYYLILVPFPPTGGPISSPISKVIFWRLVSCVILLTWIGARPVEAPYIFTGQALTIAYFLYFICIWPTQLIWASFFKYP